MKILIKNGNVILFEKTADNNIETVVKNLDVYIVDDKIERIGKDLDIMGSRVIDATGKVVMPGLINMHTHIPMSLFRETVEGSNLNDWLSKDIWPKEAKLTNDDVFFSSMLSLIEAVKTGTTLLNDHYFLIEGILKAVKEIPVRYAVTRVLMDLDGNGQKRIDEFFDLYFKRSNETDLPTNIYNIISPHGLYTSSEVYIERVGLIAKESNYSVHTHFCENSNEVDLIKKKYNVENPSEVLIKYFSNLNLILAHCVKLNDEDILNLKKLNANVVHNPVSNLRLGCGIAPVKKMLDEGINVCLGTDGQGSGSSLDMFESIRLSALLQKGNLEDPTVIPASKVIQMATINGARALKMDDKIGSIEVGKKADIIILNINDICFKPVNNMISDIVYNANGRDVECTIVNGKILMENRKVEFDEEYIAEKCIEIFKRISN